MYRGREGMWSWVAHRVTGVLIFFFLFVHVLDTSLVRVSPEAYDTVIATYKNPIVNVMEFGLVAAILFHALNGLRIIAVDFWSKGPKYQKTMLWSVIGLWAVLMAGSVYPVLQHTIHNLFGK
jgi:succinate dehydrogenase / fumarate reductase cytochrome b subunit